jgi:hypothetical protein
MPSSSLTYPGVTYPIFIEISEGDIPGSSLKYPGVIYPVLL